MFKCLCLYSTNTMICAITDYKITKISRRVMGVYAKIIRNILLAMLIAEDGKVSQSSLTLVQTEQSPHDC